MAVSSRKAEPKHLSKERELELGRVIHERSEAIEQLSDKTLHWATKAKLRKVVALGDKAIEELITANMGLVYDRAHRFKAKFPGSPDIEDLVQEGMTGLMTAALKYDYTRGNKFSTVAYYWIAQSIGRGVNKTGRLVRLPENRISDYARISQVVKAFEDQELTAQELDEAIMEELNLSKKDLANIRNAAMFHSSLNKQVGNKDEGTKELIDLVSEDFVVEDVGQEATSKDIYKELLKCVASLEELQQEVVSAHFSLPYNGEYKDPVDVKEQYSLTHSKYRRHLNNALANLKEDLLAKGLNLSDFLS